MKKQTLHNYYLPCLLGVAAFGLIGWNVASLHAKEAPLEEPVVSLVREGDVLRIPEKSPLRRSLVMATLSEQAVQAPFTLPAVVEADPARLVKVLPPVAGRIVRLNKRLGDEVKSGEVLFVIDAPDVAQAGADAGKAQAALTLARRNLARQRELTRSEIAAGRDLEQAQSDYEEAASEAARAELRLRQIGAGGTNGAGGAVIAGDWAGQGGRLAVRSPLAGRVVALAAAEGGYWNDTTAPLMTVADLSKVFISASAQEKDVAQLYVGQQAEVRIDAYAEPVRGKIGYIGELLDADTRTVKVRLAFDNRDARLKPGMFAQATLHARAHQGIVVPMTAVIQNGFASRAFVEVRPGQFVPRDLTLGAQIGEQVEVLSGLKANERVVIKGGVLLND